jgi:hypothetical protein
MCLAVGASVTTRRREHVEEQQMYGPSSFPFEMTIGPDSLDCSTSRNVMWLANYDFPQVLMFKSRVVQSPSSIWAGGCKWPFQSSTNTLQGRVLLNAQVWNKQYVGDGGPLSRRGLPKSQTFPGVPQGLIVGFDPR